MTYHRQETKYTCGPACMKMALGMLGIRKPEKAVAKLMRTGKRYGTLNKNFPLAAKKYNLGYISAGGASVRNLRSLMNNGYVVIVCYFLREDNEYHYAVVKRIGAKYIHLYDPWFGPMHRYTTRYFMTLWKGNRKRNEADRWFFAVIK